MSRKKRQPFKVPGGTPRVCVCCHYDVRGGDYKRLRDGRVLCASCEKLVRAENSRKAAAALEAAGLTGTHARERLERL